MEQLRKRLDAATLAILEGEKVTDDALPLLTDELLCKMGVLQAGPRIIILGVADNMKHNVDDEPAVSVTKEQDSTINRALFEKHGEFRHKYLYRVLDKGMVPDSKGINAITRIACTELVARIEKGGQYPEAHEQEELARQILKVFPQLDQTRVAETAPPESRFFWKHSGAEKGAHSGSIYHHVRNTIRKLPSEMHKFTRAPKRPFNDIDEASLCKAEDMRELQANRDNFSTIRNGMKECFELHKLMLKEKNTAEAIIVMFPHFRSFNGIMIHDAFGRLYPDMKEEPDLHTVFQICLFLSPTKFGQIEDAKRRIHGWAG
nr:uncharacterized protein LOC115266314 isoform X2 [Aedes albopictus]